MTGWVANIFLLLGTWFLGSKKVLLGLVISLIGTVLWLVRSIQMKEPDLVFINIAFTVLTIRAVISFSRESP